jgi:hypothetical protein
MTSHWKYARLGAASLVLVLLGSSAQAASAPKLPARADLVRALSECRSITDPTERLACFDKTAAALDEAQTKGEVVVVDRQQAQEVKRQAFGFRLDALSIFDRGGPKDRGEDAITALAQSAHRGANGHWIINLEGGAVWRQIDDEELSREPHQGSAIRIRKATLGSFMMNVDGQPGIRVHRDE